MNKSPMCLLAAAVIGCAAPSGRMTQNLDAKKPVASDSLPAINAHALDEGRDQMQFELAEQRWRRNELPACQQMLEELVGRNAAHRQANLRLAEIYLSQGQPQQALSLMQRYCRAHRDDAEAHHLLGVAYEGIGQAERALAAYDVAATLDPDDRLVRTSLENILTARDEQRAAALPARTALPSRSSPPTRTGDSPLLTSAGSPTVRAEPKSIAPKDTDDVSDDLPPRRAPGSPATAAADREPKRLDHEIMAAIRAGFPAPAGEVVSVSATEKNNLAQDAASSHLPSTRAAALLPSDSRPPANSTSPDKGDTGDSSVRWAYELEAGEPPPALPDARPDAEPAPDQPLLESAKGAPPSPKE